jgi:EAL domain-containing protein (putative c-di-GMP-specific phosphodiesterase class I)
MPTTQHLADDLASAVGGSQIYAVYQPQVSLETGSIVAAEALCRWEHPQLGEIDPATMIDLAEETGTIHALGRRMLDECLDKLAEWRATGRAWAIALNVSPLQLEDGSFAGTVAAELTRRELPPGSLILELTRHLKQVDGGVVLTQLRTLRELGVELSLGGYGAGASSLGLLQTLPLTEVKLPGHLVRAAEGLALASLREDVAIAHAHGLRVVAEGIESLTHLDIAVQLGADRAQGFLIRQPDAEIVFP